MCGVCAGQILPNKYIHKGNDPIYVLDKRLYVLEQRLNKNSKMQKGWCEGL